MSGEPLKEWKNDYYILGMDAANNLITTRTSMVAESKGNFIGDMQGLFLMDRKSGKILKTLRSDALYHRSPGTKSMYIQFHFNTSMTALLIQTDLDAQVKQVYPFESTEVVQLKCGRLDNPNLIIGDRYVLETYGSTYSTAASYVSIYDLKKGGDAVLKQNYDSRRTYQSRLVPPMIFAFKNDLFRFDRENLSRWEGANLYKEPNVVYEEEVENGALKLVNQWNVDMRGESVTSEQKYRMVAGKGPTLLIYPLSSGVDNRGFLIDLPSQKLTRTIVPFFNPDANTLAQEARLRVATEEWEAKKKKDDRSRRPHPGPSVLPGDRPPSLTDFHKPYYNGPPCIQSLDSHCE